MSVAETRRIAVLGYGAIGRRVAEELASGTVCGAQLAGIVTRDSMGNSPTPQLDLASALQDSDLIVECAGQPALVEYGEMILSAGVDLLITSVGALADPDFSQRLRSAGPGRLFLTSGAVGGLDLLASGARSGGYDKVLVTTTKLPGSLVQPWMSLPEASRLRDASGPIEIFRGCASEAAKRFPKSLNVTAAVAVAIEDWQVVTVVLIADPAAELTTHLIEASGDIGEYRFEIRNRPSPENPSTSGIVPFAVLRSLELAIALRGGLI